MNNNMEKEKVIKFLIMANVVILAAFSPVMFFMLLFGFTPLTLEHIFEEKALLIMSGGYLWAIIFCLMAFKKKYFLLISFVGWLMFFAGDKIDKNQTEKTYDDLCIELRNDKNCTETDNGTIVCKNGDNSGVYPGICN